MGIIYKLKPEIKEFILKEKEKNPNLSCRKFVSLIERKFKIKLSKSHINSVIKSYGLSNPKGRTPKIKRIIELEGLGVIILKVADLLLGGLKYISQLTNINLSFLEAYLYLYLFEQARIKDMRWQKIIGPDFNYKEFLSYLSKLQEVIIRELQVKEKFSQLFQEVLAIKLTFFDGRSFYFDAQLHCLWSTTNIPWDFSTTYCKIKSYIDNLIKKNPLFVLFSCPGYETPPVEWFEFLLRLPYLHNKVTKITLLGVDLKELEIISLEEPTNPFFIFGLWPWQYTKIRRIEQLSEFKPYYFSPLKKEFLIGETRIILTQPVINKSVTLRGIILKLTQESIFSLTILTNLPKEKNPAEEVLQLYLDAWPNLKEGFEDFSKKIEFFTYHLETHKVMPKEDFFSCLEKNPSLDKLLQEYLFLLDTYVRWKFFPLQYRTLDFSLMKERFYNLKVRLKKEKDQFYFTFKVPQNYPFLKDLKIACQRINENRIFLEEKRLWVKI